MKVLIVLDLLQFVAIVCLATGLLEQGNDSSNDTGEMFRNEAKNKGNDRHYYSDLILCSVASFLIGAILVAFFKALGLGGLLIGILLGLLSGYLAKRF